MRQYPKWLNNAYVGLHYDLHAHATDSNLGAELTNQHLREQLEKVKPDFVQCDCKGHPGYSSYPTKIGSPSPGIVRDALRIHRDVTAEMNLPLLVHYSGLWDNRAVELHPGWAAIDVDGKPISVLHNDGSSLICMLSPYVEELMIPQMLEVIDEYSVDGFWIDGDNWAVRDCYCPRCKKEFFERTGIAEPPRQKDDPNWIEWRKFRKQLFTEYVTKYANAIHAHKPDCAVCSNWMYSMRHPGPIEAPVDFISGDFIASFGCERAAMEGRFLDSYDLPWNLMAWAFCRPDNRLPWQFKTADHLKQESAEVLSCGGSVFIYDLPQRSGWLTDWHQAIMGDVVNFCRERQEFCQHTQSVPEAAVLHSETHALHNSPEVFSMGESYYRVGGALHALMENHYHVDILDEHKLEKRISDYNLVVVAEQNSIPPSTVKALESYAKQGGVVLMTGCHLADAHGCLLGVESACKLRESAWHAEINGEVASFQGPWQPVSLIDAKPYANILTDQQPGKDETQYPAVTIREIGKGKIVGVHGDIMLAYYLSRHPRIRNFIAKILEHLEVQRQIKFSGPSNVEVTLRKKENKLMVNFVNRAVNPTLTPQLHIVEKIPPVGPIEVDIKLNTEPANVKLEPNHQAVEWNYNGEWLKVKIDTINIHDILVIEWHD